MMSGQLLAAQEGASTVQPVYVSLAIAGLFAWRGYRVAQRVEQERGKGPYGWEPTTWSIICFCTLLFGRLLLAAAVSRGAKQGSRVVQPVWAPAETPPLFAYPTPPPPQFCADGSAH